MPPLPLPMAIAHCAIHKRNRATGNQNQAQGLAIAIEGRGVDGQAHENIPDAVNGHEAVDHFLVGGESGWLEFKESEGIGRADDGVDAESYEDCCEDIGGDVERGGLREGGGGHCSDDFLFVVFWVGFGGSR